jgi:hypothetical protein
MLSSQEPPSQAAFVFVADGGQELEGVGQRQEQTAVKADQVNLS